MARSASSLIASAAISSPARFSARSRRRSTSPGSRILGVDLLIVRALLALPVIHAFLRKDLGTALAIGAGIFGIEQVMGNHVDPRVQGRQAFVVFACSDRGHRWRDPAVPIPIAAVILCARVRPLHPFALMLSNAREMDELDRQAKGADR